MSPHQAALISIVININIKAGLCYGERLRSHNTKNFLLNAKRGSGKVWFVKCASTKEGDRFVSNMNITHMQIRLGRATPRLLVWGRTEGGVGSLWLRPREMEQPRPFAVSARNGCCYYKYNNERNGEWTFYIQYIYIHTHTHTHTHTHNNLVFKISL